MNKNLTLLRFFADNERYADLINGYAGTLVVHPKDLAEADTMTHTFSLWKKPWDKRRKERYRDLFRKASFGLNFAIIGVENQSEVNYLMPLRNMSYDVSEYEKQAHFIGKKVRKMKRISSAEFLSRFLRTNKLHPCITFVLYWGDNWDGAMDLHGLLDFQNIPTELKKFVNNYPLHLINMKKFENTNVFRTDLKQVFDFIQNSKNKSRLNQLVTQDSAYKDMDEDAYDVIAAFTNAKELKDVKTKYEEGGRIDMCQALTELIMDGRMEGISIGRNEGISIGRDEQKKDLIKMKLSKGKTLSVIADELETTLEEIEQFMKAM